MTAAFGGSDVIVTGMDTGAASDSATETPLRCPQCGYDVRFASDSRCSECGRVFDRQRLERTWWPWVHRREMGRVAGREGCCLR